MIRLLKLKLTKLAGFTLTEILVVLFITSTLLFMTTSLLKNLQKISSIAYPLGYANQEQIQLQNLMFNDLQSSLPHSNIAEQIVLENGKQLNLYTVDLDNTGTERLNIIQWQILEQRLLRKIIKNQVDFDFQITHQFKLPNIDHQIELLILNEWQSDFTATKLFMKPQAIQIKDLNNWIFLAVNVF